MSKHVVNIESPPAPNGAYQSDEIVCATEEDAKLIATYVTETDSAGWTVDSITEYEEPTVFTFASYVQLFAGVNNGSNS